MCSPQFIVAGLQIGQGLYNARAQYQAGLASAAYMEYQAKQRDQEAELTTKYGQQQANAVQDTAKFQSAQLAKTQAKEASSQRVALAAAGVFGGTATDVSREALTTHNLDQAILRYNADLKSNSIINDATYRSWAAKTEAGQLRFGAENAKRNAKRQAFSTLLGTAVSVATTFGGGGGSGSGSYAVPGFGGYGANTPLGTRNMGTFSTI